MYRPFLSKDPRTGNYLIRYQDEVGGWHSKSTGTTKKYEALDILKTFDMTHPERDLLRLYPPVREDSGTPNPYHLTTP